MTWFPQLLRLKTWNGWVGAHTSVSLIIEWRKFGPSNSDNNWHLINQEPCLNAWARYRSTVVTETRIHTSWKKKMWTTSPEPIKAAGSFQAVQGLSGFVAQVWAVCSAPCQFVPHLPPRSRKMRYYISCIWVLKTNHVQAGIQRSGDASILEQSVPGLLLISPTW